MALFSYIDCDVGEEFWVVMPVIARRLECSHHPGQVRSEPVDETRHSERNIQPVKVQ